MIFIYDILANFNDDLIDFYDWNESDYLEHIRKIPMIKVSDKFYSKLINKNVKVSNEFLNKIKNKTEVFSGNEIERIEYGVLISSNVDAFLCLFDKNGLIKELSKLLIDEELEIIEIAKGLEYYKLDYSYIDNNNEINRYLRSEKKVINKIINLLKTIKEENNESLLKYLYYEWFLKSPKSKNYYNKLINDIKKEYSPKHKQFLEIINITSK